MDDDQSRGEPAGGAQGLGDPPAADQPPTPGPAATRHVQEPSPDAAGGEPQSPGGPKPDGQARKGSGGSRSFWRELGVLVVLAIVIALIIKTFVVQAFFIPSSSMEDTLLVGDKVLVNKLVYHMRPIHPGDIIVFDGAGSWDPVARSARGSSNPVVRAYDDTLLKLFRSLGGLFGTTPGQTDYIKRVIGTPGDHVACCNPQGLMTVNGVPLHEKSYLYPGAAPSQIHFSVTVPKGRLWVMGDNRAVSDDSRLHTSDPGGGTIPENMVIGRAFMIVWPPSRWRILPIPATFDQAGINRPAAAALGAVAGPAAPFLPLAGGFATALPVTLLGRRVRLRRGRARRRR
jgi:signal peptidase I